LISTSKDDKSKSIKSDTDKRKTSTTRRKEGCIGGRKDSSGRSLAGIIAKPHHARRIASREGIE